ncbi:MAG: SpoIVB peptidase [Sporolactobacillus sp.]
MKKGKDWLTIITLMVLLGFVVLTCGMKAGRIVQTTALGNEAMAIEKAPLSALLAGGALPITMENRKLKVDALHQRQYKENTEVLSFFTKKKNTAEDVRLASHILLVPGGESIGVKVNTKGVLVVGYHLIDGNRGQSSPGESAGIRIGDVITRINNQPVRNINDVRHLISDVTKMERPLKLDVLRQKTKMTKELVPMQNRGDRQYQLGLYIRDSASGIGTMTFYDPKTKSYGALGHVISDRDTGQPILVKQGKIVRSSVQAIDKGAEGKPGEKIAFFPNNAQSIGTVDKNTPFGIYGHIGLEKGASFLAGKPMPIALAEQVHEGPAQILTVLSGDQVQTFDIQILNSIPQKYPATKGLVIKITDPKLLKATGGIIQGMSGSPIIQNGKLVGAVTHVFVNDPTCGYGVHVEWMLHEANINIYEKKHERDVAS